MPSYSETSRKRLNECHPDIKIVFNEVVKYFDNSIIQGHRPISEQRRLYAKGRTEPGKIVTNCDGVKNQSKHNIKPSMAVDCVPYPIDWENINRMKMFIGFVLGVATMLKKQGKITHELVSGIDWDNDTFIRDHQFLDHPHFELK